MSIPKNFDPQTALGISMPMIYAIPPNGKPIEHTFETTRYLVIKTTITLPPELYLDPIPPPETQKVVIFEMQNAFKDQIRFCATTGRKLT